MHCVTCHTHFEPGAKRCPGCGRRVRDSLVRPAVWLVVTAAFCTALYIGVHRVNAIAKERGALEALHDSVPRAKKGGRVVIAPLVPSTAAAPVAGASAVPTTAKPTSQPLQLGGAEASATSPAAQNGCGEQVVYQASQVVDGSPETAWRVPGDGRGATLTVSIGAPAHVTAVGLIAGYDKVDRCTNADRFVQMRRITKVRWRFDDGTVAEQTFQDSRNLQVLPVDVVTARVVIEVVSTSVAPELDYTAISEVRLFGLRG